MWLRQGDLKAMLRQVQALFRSGPMWQQAACLSLIMLELGQSSWHAA
jgi:hypothetical protein